MYYPSLHALFNHTLTNDSLIDIGMAVDVLDIEAIEPDYFKSLKQILGTFNPILSFFFLAIRYSIRSILTLACASCFFSIHIFVIRFIYHHLCRL